MEAFYKDIFAYHNHFNQLLAEQLLQNVNKLPKRTVPLFSHSINAHQIWNARINKTEELGVHQLHTLEECKRIDSANYQTTLKILDTRKMNETVTYANSKGIEFNNPIHQILFHIANHFSHHKGQIISDVRQSGIDPIVTDYIFYKR